MDELHTIRYAEGTCGAPARNVSRRLIVSQWVLFSLAFIFVVLRFVSRMQHFGGRIGWDDWTILVVLSLSLSVNILGHILLNFGVGQDIWMLEEHQLSSFFKVSISRHPGPVPSIKLTRPVFFFSRDHLPCRGFPFESINFAALSSHVQLPDPGLYPNGPVSLLFYRVLRVIFRRLSTLQLLFQPLEFKI